MKITLRKSRIANRESRTCKPLFRFAFRVPRCLFLLLFLPSLALAGGASSPPAIPGGTNGQMQYNNNGLFGGWSAAQAYTFLGVSANGQTLLTHNFAQMLVDIGGQPAGSYAPATGSPNYDAAGAAAAVQALFTHVTNDAQTKAAIVPNTAPTAGQLLVGNAGNSAYAPVSMSQDATIDATGKVTITGTSSASPFGFGTHSPGLNTPYSYFQGFGASTSWPVSMGVIYNASAVDQYLILGGYLNGGSYAAPTLYAPGGAAIVKYDATNTQARLGIVTPGTAQSPQLPLLLSASGETLTGSSGGLQRYLAEATTGALSGASGTITLNVPTGARLLGVQLRVDTAIASGAGSSWSAVYTNTPTTEICSGQAFTRQTKFGALHPAYEIATGTVAITITPNTGTFTAGVVRAIVYYEALAAMANAP